MKNSSPFPIRMLRRPVVLTLGLIALFDFLFYLEPIGFTAGIYVGLTTSALMLLRPGLRRAGRFVFIAVAQAWLIVSMVEEPGIIDAFLAMMSFIALPIIAGIGVPPNFRDWGISAGRFVGEIPIRAGRDSLALTRRVGQLLPFLSRIKFWVIPIVLSLVFVKLFALANPIIQGWTERIEPWLVEIWDSLTQWLTPWRLLMWITVGALIWGYLRHRPRALKTDAPARWLPPIWSALVNHAAGQKVILNCLILFNLVFAAQTILDIVYLFGGAELPKGMTYAEYAHRGAYPLIVTALLAAAFVLLTFSQGAASASNRAMKRLVFLWLAQNVFLTFSSIWRLDLYVDVYSLTRLRFAAGMWMALVALGLILIGLRIVRDHSNQWLFNANMISVVATFFLCGTLNIDGMIARYNFKHCKETGGRGVALDINYLEALGIEATPVLYDYCAVVLDRGSGWTQSAERAFTEAKRLHQQVQDSQLQWRGWTLRRRRLLDQLQGRALQIARRKATAPQSPAQEANSDSDAGESPASLLNDEAQIEDTITSSSLSPGQAH